MKKLKFLLYFFISITIVSCSEEIKIEPEVERGKLISSFEVTAFTVDQLKQTLQLGQITVDLPLKNGFKLVKITYSTITPDGKSTIASGAIFVPDITESMPIFSFQHGTQTKRAAVVSNELLFIYEGITGGIGASLGYISCVPDYLGLGESKILHPYLDAKTSAACVVDIILATKAYCKSKNIALNNKYYLGGYSQGGYVTMAAQKEIETNYKTEIPLSGSAPMAGPFDLENTITELFNTADYPVPGNAAFLMYTYNYYYKFANVTDVFAAPYNSKIAALFDGSKSMDLINPELTPNLKSMFNATFSASFIENKNSALWTAVKQNAVLNWKPTTPMLLVHGNADLTVPYSNSTKALSYFQSQGATNIILTPVPDKGHVDSAIPAVLAMFAWFKTL